MINRILFLLFYFHKTLLTIYTKNYSGDFNYTNMALTAFFFPLFEYVANLLHIWYIELCQNEYSYKAVVIKRDSQIHLNFMRKTL